MQFQSTFKFLRLYNNIFCTKVAETCSAQCHPLEMGDYNHLLWTTLAEFPGIILSLFLIERIGRKHTMALEFLGM
jgi:hypothetical protein